MKEAKAKGHLPYCIVLRLLPCLVQLGSGLVLLRHSSFFIHLSSFFFLLLRLHHLLLLLLLLLLASQPEFIFGANAIASQTWKFQLP